VNLLIDSTNSFEFCWMFFGYERVLGVMKSSRFLFSWGLVFFCQLVVLLAKWTISY